MIHQMTKADLGNLKSIKMKGLPDDLYYVSDSGHIYRRLDDTFFRELKGSYDKNNHVTVQLCWKSFSKYCLRHRLVAEYFLIDFDPELPVDHIDGSSDNAGNLKMRFPSVYEVSPYHSDWISDDEWFNIAPIESEEWITLSEYQGHIFLSPIEVSNKGRVKGSSGKIMRSQFDEVEFNKKGYSHLKLSFLDKDRKLVEVSIHKLVAFAFLGYPSNNIIHPECHHKNKDPRDNRVENLEWLSREEHLNIHFPDRFRKRYKIVDSSGEHTFNSQIEANEYLGRGGAYVSSVVKRKTSCTSATGEVVHLYEWIANSWKPTNYRGRNNNVY